MVAGSHASGVLRDAKFAQPFPVKGASAHADVAQMSPYTQVSG